MDPKELDIIITIRGGLIETVYGEDLLAAVIDYDQDPGQRVFRVTSARPGRMDPEDLAELEAYQPE